jgi:hypothetical protein
MLTNQPKICAFATNAEATLNDKRHDNWRKDLRDAIESVPLSDRGTWWHEVKSSFGWSGTTEALYKLQAC